MKTTVDLPANLIKQVKLRAVGEGKKLNQAFADTLRAGLRMAAKGNRVHKRAVLRIDPETGLPVIKCSSLAAARKMTAAQLLKLERDSLLREDLERHGISVRQ